VENVTGKINTYLPEIAELFWEPTIDVSVIVSSYNRTAAPRDAIASAKPELDDKGRVVGLNGAIWVAAKNRTLEDTEMWVHEFTHIFQFTIHSRFPVWYTEAVADAVTMILLVGHPGSPYVDEETGKAAYLIERFMEQIEDGGYYLYPGWLELYAYDSQIFRRLNAEIAKFDYSAEIAENQLRELLTRVLGHGTVLDNLPLERWYDAFGFCDFDRVENRKPFLSWSLCTVMNDALEMQISVVERQDSQILFPTPSKGQYTVLDAHTRYQVANGTVEVSEEKWYTDIKASYSKIAESVVVRFSLKTIYGQTLDKSVLLHRQMTIPEIRVAMIGSDNFILPVNGTLLLSSGNARKSIPVYQGLATIEREALDSVAQFRVSNLTVVTSNETYHYVNLITVFFAERRDEKVTVYLLEKDVRIPTEKEEKVDIFRYALAVAAILILGVSAIIFLYIRRKKLERDKCNRHCFEPSKGPNGG